MDIYRPENFNSPVISRLFTQLTYRQSTTVPSVSESKIQLQPCGHISADTTTCGHNEKFADSHKTVRTPLYEPIFLFFIFITWALKCIFLLRFFLSRTSIFRAMMNRKNFRSLALEPQGISNTHLFKNQNRSSQFYYIQIYLIHCTGIILFAMRARRTETFFKSGTEHGRERGWICITVESWSAVESWSINHGNGWLSRQCP